MKSSNNFYWPKNYFYLFIFICLFICLFYSTIIAANKNHHERLKTVPNKHKSSNTYCGLYCLYSVLSLYEQEVNFYDLVLPEFIGSEKGSTLKELKKASEKFGLYSFPVGKLTSKNISKINYPIILHVKSSLEKQYYDHYELFLGTRDGKAILLDPPNPIKLVPFNELAPHWDGNGLIVSNKPIDLRAVVASSRKRFILYAVIVISIILCLHFAKRFIPREFINSRIKLMGLSVTQAGGIAVLALIIGMLYHFGNDTGLLANAKAIATIQEAHAGNFIPKITERKVHKLLGNHTIFIDARLTRDYKAGHLEGAISVPVDANDVERQKVTSDIDKDARVVLYCQSAGCKYAERVALKLVEDGYTDISIYKGGWAEWKAKNGEDEGTSS